jgi:hypothetical protein
MKLAAKIGEGWMRKVIGRSRGRQLAIGNKQLSIGNRQVQKVNAEKNINEQYGIYWHEMRKVCNCGQQKVNKQKMMVQGVLTADS